MNHINQNVGHTNSKTRDLVVTSLLVSLVFIATRFINFRLPLSINGGLVHLGNVMLFLAAIVFGPRKGAIAGAFGMGLFDIVSGWMAWAPFTFVIRGMMGLIVGTTAYMNDKDGRHIGYNTAGVLAAGIFMIAGYYATEGILYGNWLAPATSIPGNIMQLVFGAIVALPVSLLLKKHNIR